MEISVFEFRDYKRYLKTLLTKIPGLKHGGRLRFAEAMGCQAGYVTQVLNGSAHLSLEQAEALSRYLILDRRELGYFLLLVNHARSSTPTLREYYTAQLESLSVERLSIKDRIKPSEILSATDQATYYSSWHYAVVHMLATLEDFPSREEVAARLGIAAERVVEIQNFLESAGLIARAKDRFRATEKRVFIDKHSLFNYRHHANFRQLAMRKLDELGGDDFHYSGVHTLSLDDRKKVVEFIRDLILKSRELIKASPEEAAFGFNIDFFEI